MTQALNPPQPVQLRGPDPRTPHPSWRQAITGANRGAGQVTSARDFWDRLGL